METAQEDAEQFFHWLHPCLEGPLIKLAAALFHGANPDASDARQEDPVAVLSLPIQNSLNVSLEKYMEDNLITDLRRCDGKQAEPVPVNAHKV